MKFLVNLCKCSILYCSFSIQYSSDLSPKSCERYFVQTVGISNSKNSSNTDGRTIVAGSAYYTHGMSVLILKLMELKEISHILKNVFDFVERTEKDLDIGTALRVADIKSFYKIFLMIYNLKHLSIGLKNCNAK